MTGDSTLNPAGTEGTSDSPAQQPLLRVVSGNPTPEELAALVTVIAAASASASGDVDEPALDGWGSPTAMHRAPMPAPGPDAWRQLGRR